MFVAQIACAGSATWNANPPYIYWSNPADWTPATVPIAPEDTATFDVSTVTTIEQVFLSVGSIVFNPGASAYTLNPYNPYEVTMSSAGIINNSGVMQTITVPAVPVGVGDEESTNLLTFANNATAGVLVQYPVYGSSCGDGKTDDGGLIYFKDTSTAGSAAFTLTPGGIGYYDCHGQAGEVDFFDSSSAENATFTNYGAVISDAHATHVSFSDNSTAANATFTNYGGTANHTSGGDVSFYDQSSAGNAIITNNPGAVLRASGSYTYFYQTATAGNATLIANGGVGKGGNILFTGTPDGGTARIEVFGNGRLDVSGCTPGLATGSLEGDGLVFLGSRNLTLGSNNLSTTFSGRISGTRGTLTKTGTGTLILDSANVHTGGTTVSGGFLLINNTSGSGTGSGPVQATGGTLGGDGIISGSVTIGPGALAPGKNIFTPGTLTIGRSLSLLTDAIYRVGLNSDHLAADNVSARGVNIQAAQINLSDRGATTLPPGTVLIVIDNIGKNPISGAFSNLADGSNITAGNNTYQANYEGGDGNDLTLTVVQ